MHALPAACLGVTAHSAGRGVNSTLGEGWQTSAGVRQKQKKKKLCVIAFTHHHLSTRSAPLISVPGVCECSDFTAGTTCERCRDGYHGNALIGTPVDCQPCPCPNQSSCTQIAATEQVVCTNCPIGQTGERWTGRLKWRKCHPTANNEPPHQSEVMEGPTVGLAEIQRSVFVRLLCD